ncbi:hypothetical protein [Aeromonas media]|uniref:hypothetical protein n=1 Tax=Aeromonas media TaxID=651 RepID=UPI003D1A7F5E
MSENSIVRNEYPKEQVDYVVEVISRYSHGNGKLDIATSAVIEHLNMKIPIASPILDLLRKRHNNSTFETYSDLTGFFEEHGITGFPELKGELAEISDDDPELLAILEMSKHDTEAPKQEGVTTLNSNPIGDSSVSSENDEAELPKVVGEAESDQVVDVEQGVSLESIEAPIQNATVTVTEPNDEIEQAGDAPKNSLDGGFIMPTEEEMARFFEDAVPVDKDASPITELSGAEHDTPGLSPSQTEHSSSNGVLTNDELDLLLKDADTDRLREWQDGAHSMRSEPNQNDVSGVDGSTSSPSQSKVMNEQQSNTQFGKQMQNQQQGAPGGRVAPMKIGPIGMLMNSFLEGRAKKRELKSSDAIPVSSIDARLIENKAALLDNTKKEILEAVRNLAKGVDANSAPLTKEGAESAKRNIESLTRDYKNRIEEAAEILPLSSVSKDDKATLKQKISESSELSNEVNELKKEYPDNRDLDDVSNIVEKLMEAIKQIIKAIFGKNKEKSSDMSL